MLSDENRFFGIRIQSSSHSLLLSFVVSETLEQFTWLVCTFGRFAAVIFFGRWLAGSPMSRPLEHPPRHSLTVQTLNSLRHCVSSDSELSAPLLQPRRSQGIVYERLAASQLWAITKKQKIQDNFYYSNFFNYHYSFYLNNKFYIFLYLSWPLYELKKFQLLFRNKIALIVFIVMNPNDTQYAYLKDENHSSRFVQSGISGLSHDPFRRRHKHDTSADRLKNDRRGKHQYRSHALPLLIAAFGDEIWLEPYNVDQQSRVEHPNLTKTN